MNLTRVLLPTQNHTRFASRADALKAFEVKHPRKFGNGFEWQDLWYQQFEQWLFDENNAFRRDTLEIIDLLGSAREAIYSNDETFKIRIGDKIDKLLYRIEKQAEEAKIIEQKGGVK